MKDKSEFFCYILGGFKGMVYICLEIKRERNEI